MTFLPALLQALDESLPPADREGLIVEPAKGEVRKSALQQMLSRQPPDRAMIRFDPRGPNRIAAIVQIDQRHFRPRQHLRQLRRGLPADDPISPPLPQPRRRRSPKFTLFQENRPALMRPQIARDP